MKRPEPMTLSKDVLMENAVQYLNRRKCGEGPVAKALEIFYFIFEQEYISKTR